MARELIWHLINLKNSQIEHKLEGTSWHVLFLLKSEVQIIKKKNSGKNRSSKGETNKKKLFEETEATTPQSNQCE